VVPKSGDKNNHFSPNAFSNWGVIKHGVPQGSISGSLTFSSQHK
jgi:hypothetical protein